jgi:1-acyl-sn-glycerol-3-phosphate acyltransferase
MFSRLVSLLFWVFVGTTALLLFPVAVVRWIATAWSDRNRVVLHQFTCFWASLYTWCNPLWRVRVDGREHIAAGTAYVMVANHSSAADIFLLHRLFRHFKWVSKVENFRVPFIGWNMRLNGYIPLRRGDKESVLAMLAACRRSLAAGSSVMLFPEGTRSKTQELRPFKAGAFELANDVGAPLLPIVLIGTREALPKHGLLCGRARMHIRILPPITPVALAGLSALEAGEHVRSLLVKQLAAAAQ